MAFALTTIGSCASANVGEAQTDVCVSIVERSWAEAPVEWRRPEPDVGGRPTESESESDVGGPPAESESESDVGGPPAESESESDVGGPPAESDSGFADDTLAPEALALDPLTSRNAQTEQPRPVPRAPTPATSNPRPVRIRPQRDEEAPEQRVWVPVGDTLMARSYLKRLFEHYVTHADGYRAVDEGCTEHLTVELYPLDSGWTIFARYSGHSREEKINRVTIGELDALAQRLTTALLDDVSVQETLTRTTVLHSDSEGELRRIRGGKQFLLGLGAVMLFGARVPTSVNGGGAETLDDRFRLMVPLQAVMGMRSFYRAWALDAFLGMRVGTSRRSSSTAADGHIDYTAGFTAGLHFLRYLKPDAVSSFYLGGGASFVVDRYRATGAGGLWGGGMHLELLTGHEFMRASSLHFFVELTASVPAYRFDTERRGARLESYIPAAVLQIGLLH